MKVSEAIDRLEVGETVWAKARIDRINNEGKYIRVMLNASFVYLDGHDEISLEEPQGEKQEVSQEFADWVESVKEDYVAWQSWCVKEVAGMGWGTWLHTNRDELDDLPRDGWTEKVLLDTEKHIKAIYDGYTVKPKRWVVKNKEHIGLESFVNSTIKPMWTTEEPLWMAFTDKSKAEAVATLVEGSVEEID